MTGFDQEQTETKEARKISETEQQAFQGVTYEANGEREKTIDDLLERSSWLEGKRWRTVAIAVGVAVAVLLFGGVFIMLALLGAFVGVIRRLFR